ncbi:hypothetical protein llap_5016 [Limosa lapponica baueri]|uniref:Uncharacterized protein n=1 Tax=Limosa lapponica baueri TaxID=1758121 RepID=A0A2I0UF64_LIMLA|nr:hypothetical protein llap_5016 [Limosa lapponica baueri]
MRLVVLAGEWHGPDQGEEFDPILQFCPSLERLETWWHQPGDEGEAEPAVPGVNLGCSLSPCSLDPESITGTGLPVQYEGYPREETSFLQPLSLQQSQGWQNENGLITISNGAWKETVYLRNVNSIANHAWVKNRY